MSIVKHRATRTLVWSNAILLVLKSQVATKRTRRGASQIRICKVTAGSPPLPTLSHNKPSQLHPKLYQKVRLKWFTTTEIDSGTEGPTRLSGDLSIACSGESAANLGLAAQQQSTKQAVGLKLSTLQRLSRFSGSTPNLSQTQEQEIQRGFDCSVAERTRQLRQLRGALIQAKQ